MPLFPIPSQPFHSFILLSHLNNLLLKNCSSHCFLFLFYYAAPMIWDQLWLEFCFPLLLSYTTLVRVLTFGWMDNILPHHFGGQKLYWWQHYALAPISWRGGVMERTETIHHWSFQPRRTYEATLHSVRPLVCLPHSVFPTLTGTASHQCLKSHSLSIGYFNWIFQAFF